MVITSKNSSLWRTGISLKLVKIYFYYFNLKLISTLSHLQLNLQIIRIKLEKAIEKY